MSQNSSFISLLDDPNLTNILTSSSDVILEQIKSDGIINGHLIATTDCNVVREYIQYGNIDYYYFEGQYFIKQK